MGIKQLYNDILRKLPNEYGDVTVMSKKKKKYIYIYIYIYLYRRLPGYLDTITYVEVIFHSQPLFSIFLCISTPSVSKTVNLKQRVSRRDFFRALDVFSIIFATAYVDVKNRYSHGRHIVCFGYVRVLPEVRTSAKQQLKPIELK